MTQQLSHLFDQLLCERGFISSLSMCRCNRQQSPTPAVQAGQSSPPLAALAPHIGTPRWWLHHHVTPPWRATDQAQASDKYWPVISTKTKDFSDWEQAGTTVPSKRECLDSHQPGPTRAVLSLLRDKRFVHSEVCTTGWRWAGGRRPLSFTALLLCDDNSGHSTDRISDLAGGPSKTGMGQESPCTHTPPSAGRELGERCKCDRARATPPLWLGAMSLWKCGPWGSDPASGSQSALRSFPLAKNSGPGALSSLSECNVLCHSGAESVDVPSAHLPPDPDRLWLVLTPFTRGLGQCCPPRGGLLVVRGGLMHGPP